MGLGEPRVRYFSRKLASWFQHAVDSEGSGKVRFRYFLAALRRQPTLQLILSKEAGVLVSEEDCRLFANIRSTGHFALPPDQRMAALFAERRRIKAIFFEMCGAEGNAVDWESFLGFFVRRGLVIDVPPLEGITDEELPTPAMPPLPALLPMVSAR